MTELEDAIKLHIETYVTTTVDVLIEAEIPRPLPNPIITLAHFDGSRRGTGGMNHIGASEQGEWEEPSYYITVNTDDGSGGKITRNAVAAQLEKIAFGQRLYLLKAATEATVMDLRPVGASTGGGPTGDRKMYQAAFILDVQVIVPYTSLVL